jgi:hypothetical protein
MQLVVGSKHLRSEAVTALDVQGREHLVIVTKATWRIPKTGGRPQPIEPLALEASDVYFGEPGLSAMRYGSDFARFKPRCDVIFDAHAHSPGGQPVARLLAGFQVGELVKSLHAVGPRAWRRRFGLIKLDEPQPFTQMPLHYGMALGGTLDYEQGLGPNKQVLADALVSNPSGRGWAGPHTSNQIDGASAPCLERVDVPIDKPASPQAPIAFSAIGRHWVPRRDYAGTYDDEWRTNVFPFLPEDFDERFNQCAPEDQQMDYPQGGEPVVLHHLMPGRAEVRFHLPRLDHLKLRVLRTDYSTEAPKPVVDTLYFEPDVPEGGRFSAVWRASVPIRRRIQEFDTIAVGPVNSAWWRDKVLGLGEGGCIDCGQGSEEILS